MIYCTAVLTSFSDSIGYITYLFSEWRIDECLHRFSFQDPGLVHIANGLIDQANAGENGIASLVLWNINLSHEAMFHFSDAMVSFDNNRRLR